MAKASYKVTGVKGVVRKLQTLEPKLAKKVVRQAVRAALKPVLARVRATQPVRTGGTKRATKIYTSRTRKQVIRLRVVVPGRQAAATEWGTKRSGARSRGIRRVVRSHAAKGQKAQRFR